MRRVLLAAALATLAVPAVASAETAADFNLFVIGNMNYQGSDTEGRVAVGGNANLTPYSVGDKANANDVNLVVKGNLVTDGGSVKGKSIVGGTVSTASFDASGIQPSGTAIPVNFAAEAIRLVELSKYLNTFTDTNTVGKVCYSGPVPCQLTFDANKTGLNVFHMDGADFALTNTTSINFGANATVLINVSGKNPHLSGGMFLNGINGGGDSSRVLFNFYEATDFRVDNMDLRGSALAPLTNYLGGGGVINGQLIVNSFTGGETWRGGVGATQVNNVKFAGNLLGLTPPSVPEPSTWALMIGGFGMAGAMLRRRRSAIAA